MIAKLINFPAQYFSLKVKVNSFALAPLLSLLQRFLLKGVNK
jgi:hypothetical protein